MQKVVVIKGDGVGPEITDATLRVLSASGAKIDPVLAIAGKAAYEAGVKSGLPDDTLQELRAAGVALKAPLETPIGGGYRSVNVAIRGALSLFANYRPVRELPNIPTRFSGAGVDFVLLRENSEDLYIGQEYKLAPKVAIAIKEISDLASERIIRAAFEVARLENRSKVHVAHKGNILQLTEGKFSEMLAKVAKDYPTIKGSTIIVDNLAEKLITRPKEYEVVVMTNMNGDILSDEGAGILGSLGLAPSANLGRKAAMFEAVHGTAPDIAGQNRANPTAMILSAELMLRHLGQTEAAEKLWNAVMATLEKGEVRTGDIRLDTAQIVSTDRFADEIIKNMGTVPQEARFLRGHGIALPDLSAMQLTQQDLLHTQRVLGLDLMVATSDQPALLAAAFDALNPAGLKLQCIADRGQVVYPNSSPPDEYCGMLTMRVVRADGGEFSREQVGQTVAALAPIFDIRGTMSLLEVDGKKSFSAFAGV